MMIIERTMTVLLRRELFDSIMYDGSIRGANETHSMSQRRKPRLPNLGVSSSAESRSMPISIKDCIHPSYGWFISNPLEY